VTRKEYHRKWRAANPDKVKKYAEGDGAKRKEAKAAYYLENKERITAVRKTYMQANKGKLAAHTANYKAAKLQRTPTWADMDEIKLVYKQAASLQKLLGTPLHVDHIIPLQGKNVSGLHVADNLQIIGAKANMSKSNTWVA